MKSKNLKRLGINLIALICLIAVMAIILGTVVVSFNTIYISTKKKEFANEIYTIQKMAEEYHFKYGKYPTNDQGELDLYELGVNETNRGRKNNNEDDVYTINDEGIVSYKKGADIGGTKYYTLEDVNKN